MNDGNQPQHSIVFAAPPPVRYQTQYQAPVPENVHPARVQMAFDFVGAMCWKTMAKPAAGMATLGVEVVPGQELCHEEKVALNNACLCLSDYFLGKLDPDVWEKQRIDAYNLKLRTEKIKVAREAKHRAKLAEAGQYITCPLCKGARGVTDRGCTLCQGKGTIRVSPA